MEKDKVKVIIRWLVVVKLYGISPIKLLNKTKVKITEIKGKYFSPSLLILSNNNCNEISYSISTNACHALGMKKKLVSFKWFNFELKKTTTAPKNNKTKKFTNTKLVIEKSKRFDRKRSNNLYS